MGLDMYLEARLSTYRGDAGALRTSLEEIAERESLPVHSNLGYINLSFEVAYWRKANQVHGWFVREVQDGVDECQYSYVPGEKLVELRDLCKRALAERNGTLLPPTAGFFFGSTGVDAGYWADLENTVLMLTELTEHPRFADFTFYYHASW